MCALDIQDALLISLDKPKGREESKEEKRSVRGISLFFDRPKDGKQTFCQSFLETVRKKKWIINLNMFLLIMFQVVRSGAQKEEKPHSVWIVGQTSKDQFRMFDSETSHPHLPCVT